ncbi:10177_t:CDS:2 [Paraglomus occultum]|uniref:10177_t:CDS:1 n=1 Tax=Paraglomus occultum TaxID=144539 RepID=A0A9N9EBI7_9GLOM|nr:10177_t:CDS:2 [Paraglomus occultum]
MRSDAVKLSPTDYDYIMRYKDVKSKPLDMLRDKYPMSNTRFYRIWKGKEVCTNTWNSSLANPGNDIPRSVTEKIDRISDAKKETTPPVTLQETEDVLELHKRNQKDIEKIRASGRTLASKLSVP